MTDRITQPPSEPEALKIIMKTLRQAEPVSLALPAFDAFTLVGLMQLLTRHPELEGRMKELAQQIGLQLQTTLAQQTASSQLFDLMDLGWHSEFDVPQK